MSANIKAQDLSSHQWNDRLLLLLIGDKDDATYKRQLAELRAAEAGMQDRKLVVYQISPKEYRRGLREQGEWQSNQILFEKYKEKEVAFELVLIGLGGGVKLRSSGFLPAKALFDHIDSMPMRQEEMLKKGEG